MKKTVQDEVRRNGRGWITPAVMMLLMMLTCFLNTYVLLAEWHSSAPAERGLVFALTFASGVCAVGLIGRTIDAYLQGHGYAPPKAAQDSQVTDQKSAECDALETSNCATVHMNGLAIQITVCSCEDNQKLEQGGVYLIYEDTAKQ